MGLYDDLNVSPLIFSIVAFRFCRNTEREQSWTEEFEKTIATFVFRS